MRPVRSPRGGLQQLVKRKNFCPGGVYIYIWYLLRKIYMLKTLYVYILYIIVYVLYVYMIYAYLNTHMCTRMHLGEIGSHGFCWQWRLKLGTVFEDILFTVVPCRRWNWMMEKYTRPPVYLGVNAMVSRRRPLKSNDAKWSLSESLRAETCRWLWAPKTRI